MQKSLWVSVGLLALAVIVVHGEEPNRQEALQVGDKIPGLSAINEAGENVSLASFNGKSGVIIFFFPKADTPGCTAESCSFRDESATYLKKGYALLGASRDTPSALKAFKDKYGLNYPLLSDPDGKLAKALGVEPGKRQTVVISKEGTLEKVLKTVDAKTHPVSLLKDLDAKK
jgi:peroxiredoxin Q/BCP